MRFLLAIGAALCFAGSLFASPAAAQTTSTVTQTDGTTISTTINGLNDIRISITGGPIYGSNPADVRFTSVVPSTDSIFYEGTITQSGTTSAFTCTLNTVTKAVTGTGACDVAFASESSSPSTPTTPTTPTTPAEPTTPTTEPTTPTGGGTTTTDNGDGTTTTTTTTPDGTVVTVTVGDQAVISAVEADQLFLALTGTRMTTMMMQSFVANRIQLMSMAALAPRRMTARDGYVGRSAGAEAMGLGVWANATGSYTEDKRPGSAQDGWTGAGALGVDLTLENAVLGAYAGYDSTDLDGPALSYGSKGWTLGAYASWSSDPRLRLTATVGYGQHDVDYSRLTPGAVSVGDTNRDQVFGSISVQSQFALSERVVAVPSLGVSASSSKTDAYTDNAGRRIGSVDADLSTASLSGALFYRGDRILPYVMASLNEDLDDTPGVDGSYGVVGAGVAFPLSDSFSLAISAQRLVAKSHEEETTFGATLRRGF